MRSRTADTRHRSTGRDQSPPEKPEATRREDVDLCGLFGEEHRLAGREDDDRRNQLDRSRAAGDPREQSQRLVQVAGVLARDLVRDAQVGEAELLGPLREFANRAEVVAELTDGKGYADLHFARLSCPLVAACPRPSP